MFFLYTNNYLFYKPYFIFRQAEYLYFYIVEMPEKGHKYIYLFICLVRTELHPNQQEQLIKLMVIFQLSSRFQKFISKIQFWINTPVLTTLNKVSILVATHM